MKQEDVWRGIDRLAHEIGVTPSRLARMAGLDQAVFSTGRRTNPDGRLRWPSMDSLAKVLKVADISVGDFVDFMYADPSSRAGFRLPCMSMRDAAESEQYDTDGFPTGPNWERVLFPDLPDPRCFGLIVDVDHYNPVYRQGDMVVCAPGMSVHRNDRVAFRHGDALKLGILSRQSPFTVDISLPQGGDPETIPAQDISWIARIAWVRQ